MARFTGLLTDGGGVGVANPTKQPTAKTRNVAQQEAYDNAKALAESFVSRFGGSLSDYFDESTGIVTKPKNMTGIKTLTPTPTSTLTTTPTSTPVGTGNSVTNTGISSEIQNLQNQFNDFLTKQNEANTAANTAKLAKRESAVTNLTNRLKQYHLESLAPVMLSLAQQDASEDTIMLVLSETPEYQERFKANKTRIAKGLAVLSPKEYLAVEDSHRQVLRAAGLSRFDNDAYVTQFMENDMSPNELSSRIDLAVNRVQNGDPDTMEQLKMYGLDTVDMVAYMLDPKQVLPDIERKVATAEIGAAGRKNDLYVSAGTAGDLAARGITKAQAEQGYGSIATILPGAKKLSDIYGSVQPKYGLGDAESEVFSNLASAKRAREALISSEQGTFSASSGRSRNALSKGL